MELELPAEMKVQALKLNGAVNGEIPVVYRNGRLRFTADNAARPGGVMIYLLTRP